MQNGWNGVTYVMMDKLEKFNVKYVEAVEVINIKVVYTQNCS